jgi:magnesium transporter
MSDPNKRVAIAGVYGMNFENMPELMTENGYFICLAVLGVMFIVGLAMTTKL